MLLAEERLAVVEYGNKMIRHKLTTGSGGNISIYNREKGLVALSPSSIHYSDVKPEDVVVVDIDGNVVEGTRRPSTEKSMHLAVYHQREDVSSVVHTHSIYATAVACMGWDLEPIHYLLAMAGPVVKCAKYATYGTEQLAEYAMEALENRGACLLGNHGLLTAASSLDKAFSIAEHIEYVSQLYLMTKGVGAPNILTNAEIEEVMDKFGTNPYK